MSTDDMLPLILDRQVQTRAVTRGQLFSLLLYVAVGVNRAYGVDNVFPVGDRINI